MAYGGSGPSGLTTAAEQYDGSTWTSISSLATARQTTGSRQGTTSAALAAGNYGPGITGITEEWTDAAIVTKTITVS